MIPCFLVHYIVAVLLQSAKLSALDEPRGGWLWTDDSDTPVGCPIRRPTCCRSNDDEFAREQGDQQRSKRRRVTKPNGALHSERRSLDDESSLHDEGFLDGHPADRDDRNATSKGDDGVIQHQALSLGA